MASIPSSNIAISARGSCDVPSALVVLDTTISQSLPSDKPSNVWKRPLPRHVLQAKRKVSGGPRPGVATARKASGPKRAPKEEFPALCSVKGTKPFIPRIQCHASPLSSKCESLSSPPCPKSTEEHSTPDKANDDKPKKKRKLPMLDSLGMPIQVPVSVRPRPPRCVPSSESVKVELSVPVEDSFEVVLPADVPHPQIVCVSIEPDPSLPGDVAESTSSPEASPAVAEPPQCNATELITDATEGEPPSPVTAPSQPVARDIPQCVQPSRRRLSEAMKTVVMRRVSSTSAPPVPTPSQLHAKKLSLDTWVASQRRFAAYRPADPAYTAALPADNHVPSTSATGVEMPAELDQQSGHAPQFVLTQPSPGLPPTPTTMINQSLLYVKHRSCYSQPDEPAPEQSSHAPSEVTLPAPTPTTPAQSPLPMYTPRFSLSSPSSATFLQQSGEQSMVYDALWPASVFTQFNMCNAFLWNNPLEAPGEQIGHGLKPGGPPGHWPMEGVSGGHWPTRDVPRGHDIQQRVSPRPWPKSMPQAVIPPRYAKPGLWYGCGPTRMRD